MVCHSHLKVLNWSSYIILEGLALISMYRMCSALENAEVNKTQLLPSRNLISGGKGKLHAHLINRQGSAPGS